MSRTRHAVIPTASAREILVAFLHDGSDPRFDDGALQNHLLRDAAPLRARLDATPALIPNPDFLALAAEIDNPDFDPQTDEGPNNPARIPNPALKTTPQQIPNPDRDPIVADIFDAAETELDALEGKSNK